MKRVLIVYNTVSGSTADMAEIIRQELAGICYVELVPVSQSPDAGAYDAVIIGSPMRFGGLSRPVRKYISRNCKRLAETDVFFYMSLLYIVQLEGESIPKEGVYVDPSFGMKRLSRKEATLFDRKHSLGYYRSLVSEMAGGLMCQSMGFFQGRLVVSGLSFLPRLFMRIIIRLTAKEREGDFFHPDAVREWTRQISARWADA